jgi:hypothetical protein
MPRCHRLETGGAPAMSRGFRLPSCFGRVKAATERTAWRRGRAPCREGPIGGGSARLIATRQACWQANTASPPQQCRGVTEIGLGSAGGKTIRARDGGAKKSSGGAEGKNDEARERDRCTAPRAFGGVAQLRFCASPSVSRDLGTAVPRVQRHQLSILIASQRWRAPEPGGVSIPNLLLGCSHDGEWRLLTRQVRMYDPTRRMSSICQN